MDSHLYGRRNTDIFIAVIIAVLTFAYTFYLKSVVNGAIFVGLAAAAYHYIRYGSIREAGFRLWQEGRIYLFLMVLVSLSFFISTAASGGLPGSYRYANQFSQWMFVPFFVILFMGYRNKWAEPAIYAVIIFLLLFTGAGLLYQHLVMKVERPIGWLYTISPNITAGTVILLAPFVFLMPGRSRYIRPVTCLAGLLVGISIMLTGSRGALAGLLAALAAAVCWGIFLRSKTLLNRRYYVEIIFVAIGLLAGFYLSAHNAGNRMEDTINNIRMLELTDVSGQPQLMAMAEPKQSLGSFQGHLQGALQGGLMAAASKEPAPKDEAYEERARAVGGDRIFLWESTMQMIRDYPLAGVGLNNFNHVYRTGGYISPMAKEPDLKSPHNIYLHILVSTGFIGFIPFMLLLLYQLWYALQAARRGNRFALAYLLGMIATFTHGMVDYIYLQRSFCQFYWLLAGAVVMIEMNRSFEDEDKADQVGQT